MKHLVATTALALILSAPAMAQTQDQATQDQAAQDQAAQQQQQMAAEGYLQQLEPGDILVDELIGQDVYVARSDQAVAEQPTDDQAAPEGTATVPQDEAQDQQPAQDQQQAQDQQPAQDQQQAQDQQPAQDQQQAQDQQPAQDQQMTGDMQTIDRAQLDNMDNIGQVSDVVLGQDGQVKAIVIGVGGFLGVGEREVAVDFERVTFAVDQEDETQYYLIADTSAEQLENAPEFQRTAMRDEAPRDQEARTDEQTQLQEDEQVARADDQRMAEEERQAEWRGDREAFAPPAVEREGLQRAEAQEISADNLIGANVYDVNDDNIGSVNDVVIGQDGEVGYVVVDIGGFLGIGTHTVALGFDEVTVLHDEGWDDLRIYVEATQEQLEGMPEYAEAN